ncbi:hypothetical protein CLV56_1745 [Mumia flava]|uniref:DUF6457 domain-containing protein n=1 Tax=Mumia flava TaxID=1348852 RepID=A0A2M9BHW0_9ACTN|nr:DUF6457 domain-containing protein [Mumia flava]PJJ57512.1 hypothetical protein CLV56_1745 [Mumia flava]
MTDQPDEPANDLQAWSDEVCRELGIAPDYDLGEILDAARDVAHAVARPAAPLTAFLVGYAAATAGGTGGDVSDALRRVRDLASRRP